MKTQTARRKGSLAAQSALIRWRNRRRWLRALGSFFLCVPLVVLAEPQPAPAANQAVQATNVNGAKSLAPGALAGAFPGSGIAVLTVPAIDPQALKSRDKALSANPDKVWTFAEPRYVSASKDQFGQWEDLGQNQWRWRLVVQAPGATDINLGFTNIFLPQGCSLRLFSADRSYQVGPYTFKDNANHGQLWTPVLPGESMVIEAEIPAAAAAQFVLVIGQVNSGYRDVFRKGFPTPDKQGSCNIDVVCPAGDNWRNEIRSVAMYSISGFEFCSGSLIMNQRADFRALFLTAAHCLSTGSEAASVVVYWNYQSPSCGALCCGSLDQNQSGASLRATYANSDFTLLELSSVPSAALNVYYAGWDHSGGAVPSSVCIHHPNADEKAISFDDSALRSTAYTSSTDDPSANHWRVVSWNQGTTEPGSSGSGLWHATSHRIVGQLHGGYAACGNSSSDWFGKLAASWTGGGTAASSLSSWLDPDGTGLMGMDGADPNASTDVLQVTTIGKGTLSPNYSSAVLVDGKTYSLTAKPALGYAFTNWTGEVDGNAVLATNKPTLSFVMQPHLALTATFGDVQRPVLTLTAPRANQRWSNAVFTVAGKTTDNGPMGSVAWQLNGGEWTPAQTTNAWSNWTASVTLVPGTNTLRTYASDAAGNLSATNSLTLTYVVSDVLQVATIGRGTLSPNYSNALLEIGKHYHLAARPGFGYAFINWTGQVDGNVVLDTNKAALSFLMQSNLALTATFLDVQKPVLTITAPRPNQRWSNALFTAQGKVTDNASVSNVWYRLNGGPDWLPANDVVAGRTSLWLAPLVLDQRTNKLEAWATDAAGNRSATSSVSFVYVQSATLQVSAVGQGTVSPNYSNAVLEIGLSQTVKAAAVNGHQFQRWEVSTNWLNPVMLANATLSFVMQPNLTLTMVFADTNRPVVTVTNLAANQRLSNAVFTVRGKVTDNAGVSQVWYRLNGSPAWLPANGVVAGRTSLWSAPLVLDQPTNKFEVWAEDAAGNRSLTNRLSLTYVTKAKTANPIIPLRFECSKEGLAVVNGYLQMRLSGPPGAVVVLESSADLLHWLPIHTNTLTSGPMDFSDPQSTNYDHRFYRVHSP